MATGSAGHLQRIRKLRQEFDDDVMEARLDPNNDAEDRIDDLQDQYEDGLLEGIGDIVSDLAGLGYRVKFYDQNLTREPLTDLGTSIITAAEAVQQYLAALREAP